MLEQEPSRPWVSVTHAHSKHMHHATKKILNVLNLEKCIIAFYEVETVLYIWERNICYFYIMTQFTSTFFWFLHVTSFALLVLSFL